MPLITIAPERINVDVPEGTLLLDAVRQAGMDIVSPCGGQGTCGKCSAEILSGDVLVPADGVLAAQENQTVVLSCRARVKDAALTVRIPDQRTSIQGQFREADTFHTLIDSSLLPVKQEYAPITENFCITVSQPSLADGLSDIDRIRKELGQKQHISSLDFPLSVLQKTAAALRKEGGIITVSCARISDGWQCVDIRPGDCQVQNYGIAIDVGTTTIAVQLLWMPLLMVLDVATAYNDQITCGLDIISRINYAKRAERLHELRFRVSRTINRLISQLTQSHQIPEDQIYNVAISGNTTMIHLLLGLNPDYIRLQPYTPTVMVPPLLTVQELGLSAGLEAKAYISPAVGSYVGGDITAGLLCTDIAKNTEEICLFLDIGTNGELVIGNREFLLTCACSAGPAFEGAGIECGMRAASGAIEKVSVNPQTGEASYTIIGNARPAGICGSGMISLLAELLKTGWINSAGKLSRERESPFIQFNGRKGFYTVVPAEKSSSNKEIVLGEPDIENIIRTKAAIYAACCFLMKQVEIKFDKIHKIYIAGGFGNSLNLEDAIFIGLLPDVPVETYHYIGNASLIGTYMTLVSQKHRSLQQSIAKRMTYIELNTDAGYMDQYTGALFLPHTDLERFPTVKKKLRVSDPPRV